MGFPSRVGQRPGAPDRTGSRTTKDTPQNLGVPRARSVPETGSGAIDTCRSPPIIMNRLLPSGPARHSAVAAASALAMCGVRVETILALGDCTDRIVVFLAARSDRCLGR